MTEENKINLKVKSDQIQQPLQKESEKKVLLETSSGERIYRQGTAIIVHLPEGRSTLTTSWLNGGYRENLHYIFNYQVCQPSDTSHDVETMEGGSLSAYTASISEKLGLDPLCSTGLLTAADMRNVSIVSRSYRDIEVTAVITGGIEVNGGRAGDPASYHEENGEYICGTINTILLINANIPSYAMVNATVTATEAKTVALQQLMAPSKYSDGIATGSGTDMIAVVADRNSPHFLADTGKHSKVGEIIANCVIEATQKALGQQSGLTPHSQCDMLIRLERFGINEQYYWKIASEMEGENSKEKFFASLRKTSRDSSLVGVTTSVLHIIDEISWGLISEESGKKAAFTAIKGLVFTWNPPNKALTLSLLRKEDSILENWVRVTAWLAKSRIYCAPEN